MTYSEEFNNNDNINNDNNDEIEIENIEDNNIEEVTEEELTEEDKKFKKFHQDILNKCQVKLKIKLNYY